jgi:hypothetical protein
MVTIERPCCLGPIVVEHPLPDILRCEDCSVEWAVADPTPAAPRIAALAA